MKIILETIRIILTEGVYVVVFAWLVLTLFMLCLQSCAMPREVNLYETDYDDARRATVEAWEELIGPISHSCYERTLDAIIVETDVIPEICEGAEPGKRVVGCDVTIFKSGKVTGDEIYILDTDRTELQKADTAVHEYIHILARCEMDDPDTNHDNGAYWDEFGVETVEAYGCAGLTL